MTSINMMLVELVVELLSDVKLLRSEDETDEILLKHLRKLPLVF